MATPDPGRTFLDVEHSVSGNRWVDRLDPRGVARAIQIAQHADVPELVARIAAGRGVDPADIDDFLEPTLKALMPDPAVLADMAIATDRLAAAIANGERVGVFGDYDVDGACASALLAWYLRACGLAVDVHIPDRITEGYGPNAGALADLAAAGCRLIVTVDCGSTSFDAFTAHDASIADILVVDHHQVGASLPPCTALINPNRQDDLSDLGHLCATGVVFMLLVNLNRQLRATRDDLPDLMRQIDLVGLATVADVVPLIGLNRAFVRRGLQIMHRRNNIGLKALSDVARLDGPPSPYHLGYVLGPRINAGGRIGDATLGVTLLLERDPVAARGLAEQLDELNRQRQSTEKDMLEQAVAEVQAEMGSGEGPPVLVVGKQGWHRGIVGILASRLKDRFRRPALVIAYDRHGIGSGSARSVPGFDIGKVIRAAVDKGIAQKGGGHRMAAGITIDAARTGDLRALLEQAFADDAHTTPDEIYIDAALSAGGATLELIDQITRAGPFGTGNTEPVFALPAHRLVFAEPVGDAHVRLRITAGGGATLDGIAFRALGQPLGDFLLKSVGSPVHLAGTLSKNHWQGRARPQLRVVDAAKPDKRK